MKKRLIDCTARELAAYTKEDLLRAIAESEGRVLATETIGAVTPMLVNITNAEFVASLGSDLIMLNIFDVNHPIIQGKWLPSIWSLLRMCQNPVRKKNLSGILLQDAVPRWKMQKRRLTWGLI